MGDAAVSMGQATCNSVVAVTNSHSALARSVYAVMGIPIDAVNLAAAVNRIEAAASKRAVLLVSTPNVNFLVNSLSDSEFRESLLDSDLCCADGTPIVWIARLLRLPIKERVAGADLLDRLQALGARSRRLTVFLFGGAKGVAADAAKKLNSKPDGLVCVGTMDPGFGEVSEMSRDDIIDTLNSSGADLLSVSLGARKGQLWLHRNHTRLTIPIRAHLGAAINFQAGTIKRAPPMICSWGLEWLWRIKEERYLWKRYLNDGLVLLRLLLLRVLPLAVVTGWHQLKREREHGSLIKKRHEDDQLIMISLSGTASERQISDATEYFEECLAANKSIIVDLSGVHLIDARFFGLLLMLRKELKSRGAQLFFVGVSRSVERIFRLSELRFLLSPVAPRRFAS